MVKQRASQSGLGRGGKGRRLQSRCDSVIVARAGMTRRLKVLISAYACEPGKGSEPEVGWQWALQMARFHEVTVLTRANNRDAIERGLASLSGRQPLPEFVFHDESPLLLRVKRAFRAHELYYILWQRSARGIVARLHQSRRFDLLHHLTFAAFRYPTAISGHGVPSLWGPVGGIESIPPRLLPWSHPRPLVYELARGIHNSIEASPFHLLPRPGTKATLVLASTSAMQDVLAARGLDVRLMPTIGLRTSELTDRPRAAHEGRLRLLYVGNFIALKGIDLALQALSRAGGDATLTLVGDGDFLPSARRLTTRLQLQDRVVFRGRLPRPEVLSLYPNSTFSSFPASTTPVGTRSSKPWPARCRLFAWIAADPPWRCARGAASKDPWARATRSSPAWPRPSSGMIGTEAGCSKKAARRDRSSCVIMTGTERGSR